MKKMNGVLWILLLAGFLLPTGNAICQTDTVITYATDSSEYDSEETETAAADLDEDSDEKEPEETTEAGAVIAPVVKYVSDDSIATLKKDKAFYYMPYLDSLLRARQDALKKQPPPPPPDYSPSFWDLSGVKFVFWGIAIFIVGFLLFKLFSGQGGILTRNRSIEMPAVNINEDVPEDDLEALLQRAIKNGNYRLAVRYQFLKTLTLLGERGIVKLSTEKTNYQYATEVAGRPYANAFARLSLQYEYVWFGEFLPNNEQFESIQKEHQQFLKDI